MPYMTDIYVASQTARELIVVDPSYKGFGVTFIAVGLLFLVVGYGALYYIRTNMARSFHFLLWIIPLIAGLPFLIGGLTSMVNTHIVISADAGTLNVNKTVLSIPVSTKQYPLSQVRLVKVGVGDVCRFLYVSLDGKPAENLTGCTDRTGYSEVADAMNAFLDTARH